MEKNLPSISIEGTEFLVDVFKAELREKMNPVNRISFFYMKDVGTGYIIDYSPFFKNVPLTSSEKTIPIVIPQMISLDPEGMAKKYNLPLREVQNKTDFELMVDQNAFDQRVNKGILPTIDIEGHPFYVDLKMDMLRPKDDFGSKGIVFSEIENYYDMDERAYTIPYNLKKHEFEKLDFVNIKNIPEDIIAVSFPSERILDRIGWNRKFGFDLIHGLKIVGLTMDHKAKNIPWNRTPLPDIIRDNIERERKLKEIAKSPIKQEFGQQKVKGKRM